MIEMHETLNNNIISFLRYAIAPASNEPPKMEDFDWQGLYTFASEQAISGVVFEGVKRLGEQGVKPPFLLLMKWVAVAEQIAEQNRRVDARCVDVVRELSEAGFETVLLKGQGNALMYPTPETRTSGDIDLWVCGHVNDSSKNVDRDCVVNWVKDAGKVDLDLRCYHIGYQDNGVEVELHFTPGVMNNPKYNQRLQKWYKEHRLDVQRVEAGALAGVNLPSLGFNLVYQLTHMMHHFFDEGIGLRQMMDYYYLLLNANEKGRIEREDLSKTLKWLNLYDFAGAVMYVMHEVFGLDEKCMIVPVDERRGKTLLDEILKGGNFGKYSGLTDHGTASKYFLKIRRNMQFVTQYPAEALCEPIFRTWHFFWRMWHR